MKSFKEVLDSVIKSNAENDKQSQTKEIHKNNYVGVTYTTCLDYGYRPSRKK
jgi:hypothetical protein